MMRILILGGDGMLGHALFKQLRLRHQVRVTLRQPLDSYAEFALFAPDDAYAAIDVRDTARLGEAFERFRPQAVINAVGVVKQRPGSKEPIANIEINALLPHRLALLCKECGARLIHFSTDCVFSGKTGNYRESDPSDAEDLYGRSKFIGEVDDDHCITLRTSIVGLELSRKTSLLEWFLAQRGTVQGFRQVMYSGFTTREMGRIVEKVLVDHPEASGVYHVSSAPITKYDLLQLVKKKLCVPVEVVPNDDVRSDRSLDSSKFRSRFMYSPPSWEAMIDELAADIGAKR